MVRSVTEWTDFEETYQDGEVVVHEGDEQREMYVIQNGEVVVTKDIEGRTVEIARLHRGDFFGEMSLLESVPRSATIRSVGETRLLVIRPGSLLLKIRRNPTFAFEMLQQMSRRVRQLNAKLVELLSSGSLPDDAAKSVQSLQVKSEFNRQADGAE